MKNILLLFLGVYISYSGSAQSLVLIYNGREHSGADTLQVDSVDRNWGVMKAEFKVRNKGTREADIHVKKTAVSLLSGSKVTFCWGTNCYSETTVESLVPVTIPANKTDSSFYAEYQPAGNKSGFSIVEFTFAEVRNETNSVKVIVKFRESQTGNNELRSEEYLRVHAMQFTGSIRISYNLNHDFQFAIRDLSGRKVRVTTLPAGCASLNLPYDLKTGIYIYSLTGSEKLFQTGKLFINSR